jgi:hypothetical protein
MNINYRRKKCIKEGMTAGEERTAEISNET